MKCDIKTIFWPAWRITQNMFIEVSSSATRTFIFIPQIYPADTTVHPAWCGYKDEFEFLALEVDEIKMIDDEILMIAGKIGTDK